MQTADIKTALVTGASSGIGRAIALVLAQKGYRVALASRSTEKLQGLKQEIEAQGGTAQAIKTDVTSQSDVENAVQSALDAWGRLDVLVNSAGLMPLSYLKNRHVEEAMQMVDVNLKGTILATYAALPAMIKVKSGHIVNIASVDGKELYKGGAIYGATKAGVIAFSRAMRMELSPEFNIRVSCLEPGTVDTPLREKVTDQEFIDDQSWSEDEAKLQPEHIANAVLYLLRQPAEVNVNEILIKPTGKA